MAPPSIPAVSTVRTTAASTGTTSTTPFHFFFLLPHFGCGGTKKGAGGFGSSHLSLAPMHHRTRATQRHSSRLEAREHSRREGRRGDPIQSRAEPELPHRPRPRRTCRLCCLLWTPLQSPRSHGERGGEPQVRVRCGAVVPRPLVTSPFHLFPLPRLVFLLRACPPLLVPCALLLSSPLSSSPRPVSRQ